MSDRRSAIPRGVMISAALAAGVALWFANAKPNLFPKNFAVVEAGKVYRSGQLTPAAFRSVVEDYGIKTIVDLGSGKDHPDVERLNAEVARSLGVRRYVAALEGDARGNPNWYVWALRLATDPANQPVLVHCGAGTERTGCFVALYSHVAMGTPLEEGYRAADDFGHSPSRNPHLRPVLFNEGPRVIEAFTSGGWIEGIPVPPAGGTAADAPAR